MSVIKTHSGLVTHRKQYDDSWQPWDSTPLQLAAAPSLEKISQLVHTNELLITLADQHGRLLWTYASKANWTLLSDWVCYSAPILHPQSGELHGVLSLGMNGERHSVAGELMAGSLAQDIAQHLPRHVPRAQLEIHALGQPWVRFRGKILHVTPRMVEILCILALNPDGLTLEACHAALYGDVPVATTTLKAELSHLRTLLDGSISSRTYRLLCTVWVDFVELWTALRLHQDEVARSLRSGELLPASQSPEIREWRNCLNAVSSANARHGASTGRFSP
ncbi:helix-turn-helix domain-containing protein [Thiothrix subterranea]|uniref:helix-turn-helix domain-containing protein n=1 Tax=Thiothrix subterranea TaxID=2735563 RepID=UPI00192AE039|nr:helix-turn-helix domain-containing protein [Thiothrix subterranea]QQZ29283.1 helix-turn-helix domain-containing protein [Thiothrix subterranea]